MLLLTLAFSSCSKDDDASSDTTTLTSADLTAKIPSSLQTKSPETSDEINYMIAMMAIREGFTNSRPASRTTSKTTGDTTWVYEGYTITYTGNTSATQYLYSYTVKQNNVIFYTINGWENIDGSAGHWVLNLSTNVTSGVAMNIDFDWVKNSSNDYNLDMLITSGLESYNLIANIYNNGSGDLKGYEGTDLIFKSNWNSNGNGQYIDYYTTPPTTTNF